LKYDVALLGDTQLEAPVFSSTDIVQGHAINLVGMSVFLRPMVVNAICSDVSACAMPTNPNPRFRALNFDSITLDTPMSKDCVFGCLADAKGAIRGIWLQFLGDRTAKGADQEYRLGVQWSSIRHIIDKITGVDLPVLSGLPIEVRSMVRLHSLTLDPR
jgi:hypothetical protein